MLNFLDKIAKYIFDGQPTHLISFIAIEGLEEGYETPSLVILAGLSEKESPFIIDNYFKDTLRELNLKLNNKEDAAVFLAKSFVSKIINQQIDPFEGCEFIFESILDFTSFREKDKQYVYDGIGLAKTYGLYDQICDLKNAYTNWSEEKTNDQISVEIKQDIKIELTEWIKENPLNNVIANA